jgi:ABC-2 type transport system permease protein
VAEPSRLRFYATLYRVALKSRAEYRVDFAVGVFTASVMQLAALSFYWIVFANVRSLGSFTPAGVLFLFGVTAMVLGLSELLLNGIWFVPSYLISGEMDRLLVYPVSSLAFVLVSRPELHSLGNLVSGAVVVALSWHMAPPPAYALLLLPLWVASGAVIYTSLLVVAGCLSFGAIGPWSQHYMIVHHVLNAARYPITIYPRWLQLLMLLAFPIAAATFLPGRWLQGRGTVWLAAVAPLAAALASGGGAAALWQRSIRGYQSTGS